MAYLVILLFHPEKKRLSSPLKKSHARSGAAQATQIQARSASEILARSASEWIPPYTSTKRKRVSE